MNSIMKANVKKRKYVRKPKCQNIADICTFRNCRCDYAFKIPKTKQKIDKNFLHRQKVIKRRREIDLNRLDAEQEFIEQGLKDKDFTPRYKGYTPPKKFNYWKIPLTIGLFGLVCVLYVIIFNIIDFINL